MYPRKSQPKSLEPHIDTHWLTARSEMAAWNRSVWPTIHDVMYPP